MTAITALITQSLAPAPADLNPPPITRGPSSPNGRPSNCPDHIGRWTGRHFGAFITLAASRPLVWDTHQRQIPIQAPSSLPHLRLPLWWTRGGVLFSALPRRSFLSLGPFPCPLIHWNDCDQSVRRPLSAPSAARLRCGCFPVYLFRRLAATSWSAHHAQARRHLQSQHVDYRLGTLPACRATPIAPDVTNLSCLPGPRCQFP